MLLYQFVIALSIGIEMMSAGISHLNSFITIGVFASAPALGFTIGHFIYSSSEDNSSSVATEVIMALATGTILYVVFFEILPKAKEIGATGFQQVLAMVVGFGVFLPTLLLRKFPHNSILTMVLCKVNGYDVTFLKNRMNLLLAITSN